MNKRSALNASKVLWRSPLEKSFAPPFTFVLERNMQLRRSIASLTRRRDTRGSSSCRGVGAAAAQPRAASWGAVAAARDAPGATMSSDESSEPEDDSFMDEVEQAKMQDGAVSIRALQAGVIRAGVELDSEAVGRLGIGEVFEVLEEATTSDGNSRLRMERGWVSMTARSGKPLCVAEAAVQLLLSKVPLLQALDPEERAGIAEVLEAQQVVSEDTIIRVGEVGDCMYFLEEGSAVAEVKGEVVRRYSPGDYFGERALLTKEKRAATVRAGPDGARCLKLGLVAFDQFASKCAVILQQRQEMYDYNAANAELANSSDEEEEEEWDTDDEPEDDSLMDEGVVSIRALKGGVIREGVEMDSPKVGNLGKGEVFEVLERGTTAEGSARIRMARGWVSMTAKSGKPLCVQEAAVQLLLSKMPLLQALDETERGKIAEVLEGEQIEAGHPIVTVGEVGDAMYFLEEGEAVAEVKGEVVKRYARGDYFGERALLKNEKRAATVRAADDGARCLKLAQSSFEQFKSKLDRSVLEQQDAMYAVALGGSSSEEESEGGESEESEPEDESMLESDEEPADSGQDTSRAAAMAAARAAAMEQAEAERQEKRAASEAEREAKRAQLEEERKAAAAEREAQRAQREEERKAAAAKREAELEARRAADAERKEAAAARQAEREAASAKREQEAEERAARAAAEEQAAAEAQLAAERAEAEAQKEAERREAAAKREAEAEARRAAAAEREAAAAEREAQRAKREEDRKEAAAKREAERQAREAEREAAAAKRAEQAEARLAAEREKRQALMAEQEARAAAEDVATAAQAVDEWSDTESEPEDESFMDEIQAMKADGVVTIRALKGGVIREGLEMDSPKKGRLAPGEVFEVLEEDITTDGHSRLRMERGWVSMTAKSGKPLCVQEAAVQLLLSKVPLLQALNEQERASIADMLEGEEFAANIPIVTVGEEGDAMYFLEEGEATVEINGAVVMRYSRGDYFGELALLNNEPRKATVTAGTDGARCLKLSRVAFGTFAAKLSFKQRLEMYDYSKSAASQNEPDMHEEDTESEPEDESFMDDIDRAQQDGMVSIRALRGGIIRAGVEPESPKVGNLGKGEVFEVLEKGVSSGGTNRIRMARGWVSMTAKSGKPLCVQEAAVQLLLSKMPLLQALDETERGKIAEVLEGEQIEAGHPIVTVGEVGDAMYFLEEGEAVAEVKGEVVKRYARGDYFGERALLKNEKRAATVRAADDGARCLKLAQSSFEQFKSKLDRSVLEQQDAMYAVALGGSSSEEESEGGESEESEPEDEASSQATDDEATDEMSDDASSSASAEAAAEAQEAEQEARRAELEREEQQRAQQRAQLESLRQEKQRLEEQRLEQLAAERTRQAAAAPAQPVDEIDEEEDSDSEEGEPSGTISEGTPPSASKSLGLSPRDAPNGRRTLDFRCLPPTKWTVEHCVAWAEASFQWSVRLLPCTLQRAERLLSCVACRQGSGRGSRTAVGEALRAAQLSGEDMHLCLRVGLAVLNRWCWHRSQADALRQLGVGAARHWRRPGGARRDALAAARSVDMGAFALCSAHSVRCGSLTVSRAGV